MADGKYAEIIIDISHENVDRPYTYLIPEAIRDEIKSGCSVMVPFGAGNKLRKGIVVGFKNVSDFADDRLKYIDSISEKDISFTDQRIELAAWMKRNYGSTFIQSLKTVLPVKQKINAKILKTIVRNITPEDIDKYIEASVKKRNVAQLRLLWALKEDERLPMSLVSDKLHISAQTIKKLEAENVIRVEEERLFRNELDKPYISDCAMNLSDEQKVVVDSIRADMEANCLGTYLLYGITGSGKTEVYMQVISDVLNSGRQAIVLIPEIALTYQTLMRFYKRFGKRVGVMNSTLSQGEKYDLFEQAKTGAIDIVIGPRSALFTPFVNLGMIIIDEEHEGTYKSEQMPKYHARETAIEIARMHHAGVLLGSATPSIDSYYKAEKGEYGLFKLTKRLTGNQLANVSVVDLRQELLEGNRSILSRRLQELIEDRLSRNEQIMLFLNRRGIAGFVSCRACGFVVKCPHCDVSLSLHGNGKMVCHYCGYTEPSYKLCPKCGSKYILGFKAGTEQIEEYVGKMYPKARTLRMDADTTRDKDSYERILSKFLDREADILIGTQMIVKGHDFKNVTLVGVIAADMSLFANDFRAPEKTFQLLTQAAGRAGRGDKPGEVVIQTYQPEHYCIKHAVSQDYDGFYQEEIGYRELMDYPPASHMLSVLVMSKNETEAGQFTDTLSNRLKVEGARIIGPAPAGVSKINDIYRFVFYAKEADYDRLVEYKDNLEAFLLEKKKAGISVIFDFDPQSFI